MSVRPRMGGSADHVLSRGMNPPDTSAHNNIPELLHTVSSLDLADWPGAAVLYLEMPVEAGSSAHTAAHLQWVINGFQQASGSALDLQMPGSAAAGRSTQGSCITQQYYRAGLWFQCVLYVA